jgi:hypothetical protein
MNSCFLNIFSKFGKVRNINDLLYFFEYNSIEVIDQENLNYRQLFTEESQDYDEMAQLNLIEQSLNNINSKFFDPRKSVIEKNKNDSYYNYILKLNFFNVLKRYVNQKKNNKTLKVKINQKLEIAKVFNENLLKSRAFYCMMKWNKNMQYYSMLRDNYIEYKRTSLTNYMMKLLIYAYNRRNLIKAFIELKDVKYKKRIFEAISNKIRFRICQKKIYVSQLMNNIYSIEFINIINNIIQDRYYSIKTKNVFNNNLNKMNNVLRIRKLRTIFDKLCYSLNKLRILNKTIDELAFNMKEKSIKKYLSLFFISTKRNILLKNEVNKFLKKTFLLRYYFRKYKNEKVINTIKKKRNTFKILLLKRNFHKLKNVRTISNYKTEQKAIEFYRNKSRFKSFSRLKINTVMSYKRNYIIKQGVFYNRMIFFRKMRIMLIESLLKQGVINRINDYVKKKYLSISFISSLFKKKLEYFKYKRENKSKEKIFNIIKQYKYRNHENLSKHLKYIFNIFALKTKLNKNNKIKQKRIHIERHILFFKKLFLKKLTSKKQNDSYFSFGKVQNISEHIKLQYSIFFGKVKARCYKNRIHLTYSRYIIFKQFKRKVNKTIVTREILNFSNNMIKLKLYKHFLSNSIKLLDRKFFQNKINLLVSNYYKQSFLQNMQYLYKKKNLNEQINLYYSLKIKRRFFYTLKDKYTNHLKELLIQKRYHDYLIINSLRIITNIILNKNNI